MAAGDRVECYSLTGEMGHLLENKALLQQHPMTAEWDSYLSMTQ
jgi:hypothetical protein